MLSVLSIINQVLRGDKPISELYVTNYRGQKMYLNKSFLNLVGHQGLRKYEYPSCDGNPKMEALMKQQQWMEDTVVLGFRNDVDLYNANHK